MDWGQELDEIIDLRMDYRWGTFGHCSQSLFSCIRVKHECYLPQDFYNRVGDSFLSG